MYRPETDRAVRKLAAAVALAALLAGCSDIYYDRRDTIALGAGDDIAANAIGEVRDPWPANGGNTNIAFNGQKMQSAIERYRTDKVTPPVDPMALQGNVSPATQVNVSQTGSSTQGGSAASGNPAQ